VKLLVHLAFVCCLTFHGATNSVKYNSYQEALRVYRITPAYEQAADKILIAEAEWIAERIGINEPILSQSSISPPDYGLSGSVGGTNYSFTFLNGAFQQVRWHDWFKNISPPVLDMREFARRPSQLNTNTALQLARSWLTNLGVDVSALEAKSTPFVFHVPATSVRETSPGQPRPMRPQFIITWADPNPAFLGGRRLPQRPGHGLVVVEILGTTKQIIELRINDPKLWPRPKLELQNSDALLGADPTPAELMAKIITPEAYKIIEKPDIIEAWLLTSHSERRPKKDRLGPVKLPPALAAKFSAALLDFDSYDSWSAQKGCVTDDGARLCLKKGDDEVHISFCFECDILTMNHGSHWKAINFDQGHDHFADLLLELFPDDSVVRGIPRKNKKP
jgi:hypothetical protein